MRCLSILLYEDREQNKLYSVYSAQEEQNLRHDDVSGLRQVENNCAKTREQHLVTMGRVEDA